MRSRRDIAASEQPATSLLPYDDVRDWVQSQRNYFDGLDRAAEDLAETRGFGQDNLREDLTLYLRAQHNLEIERTPGLLEQGSVWRLDRGPRKLLLAAEAAPERQAFASRMSSDCSSRKRRSQAGSGGGLGGDEARALARVGLANYFAGALMLPYRRFLTEAQTLRYDVERLQSRFGVTFEQVCHRLSTLQRPRAREFHSGF